MVSMMNTTTNHEGKVGTVKGVRVVVISDTYIGTRNAYVVRVLPLTAGSRMFETALSSVKFTGDTLTPAQVQER